MYPLFTLGLEYMLSYYVDNEMGRGAVYIYLGVFSLTVSMGVLVVLVD